jgi:Holliday junction resolvase RusA-like endonuclease
MVTLITNALEYRVVVPGPAVSFRSTKARTYKRLIRKLSAPVFKKPTDSQMLDVRLDYFHTAPRKVDMDNVAKCVLDALNKIAYKDDRLVRLQSATSHYLAFPLQISGGPVDLVKPLAKHTEYLIVRVRLAH